MAALRKYLFAGVVSLMPLLVVVALIDWLIHLSDKAITLLPPAYRPDVLLGINIPGLGILLSLIFIIIIGALTTHFLGRRLMRLVDQIMERIPLVRSVYTATRQLLEAIFGDSSSAFQEVVMVAFPHPGSMVLGFVTGDAPSSPDDDANEEPLISVFVPSAPLPTTGWLLFVRSSDLKHLDMTVEEGMKLVLSGGTVSATNAT